MPECQDVEFKTLSGLTLRGTLYIGGQRCPAVIMTPGFNVTKDVFLPRIAQYFQKHNITALVYDPRSVGASDGTPRNDINPAEQATDYHDALTFLKSDERVDPDRIAFWGFSFSGTVALTAAALDKRAKLVVAVCPLTQWELDGSRLRGVMAKAMQDRESRIRGNAPFSVPMITSRGDNPAGFSAGLGEAELNLVADATEKIPGFSVNTTIQTYYNIMAWSPFKALRFLPPTPVLLVTPEGDKISPAANQKKLIYDAIEGNDKQQYLVTGKGHMDVLDGDTFESVMDVQISFIRQHLGDQQR